MLTYIKTKLKTTIKASRMWVEMIRRFLHRVLEVHIRKNFTILSFNALENLTKDKALKTINKITRIKSSIFDTKDLITSICKQLEEDFSGKFWIVFKEIKSASRPDDIYNEKIKQVLSTMLPSVIYQTDKSIYFEPMSVANRAIGILVAEVNTCGQHALSLGRVLPVLSDQISIIIDNNETHIKLRTVIVNEEREKLRSLILSSISHDLKTPLVSIIGSLNIYNSLSEKNKLSKENKKILITTALEEAERLNSFISDVLEMTRIESGAIKPNKEMIRSAFAIKKILERFENKLQKYELKVSLSRAIKINFDQISFEQVFQNLIENTLKYCPKDTKVTIYDEVDNDVYRIFIEDEGGGIEPSKLDLIFNKFERFALEDKTSGSGLGLSIVKALMEINNATIKVKNSPGEKGAIFILEFKDFTRRTIPATLPNNANPQI